MASGSPGVPGTEIRAALNLTGIATETGSWRHVPKARSSDQGAQIDLVLDRADGVITLCEVKFAREPLVVTKAYARELKRKLEVFERQTRTRKDVRLVLVTMEGIKPNAWSEDLVDSVVEAKQLFA